MVTHTSSTYGHTHQKMTKCKKEKQSLLFLCCDNVENEGGCCHNVARYCSFLSFNNDGGGDFCFARHWSFLLEMVGWSFPLVVMVEVVIISTQHLSFFQRQWWRQLLQRHNTSPSSCNNGGSGCCNDTTPFLLPTMMVEAIAATMQHLSFF